VWLQVSPKLMKAAGIEHNSGLVYRFCSIQCKFGTTKDNI